MIKDLAKKGIKLIVLFLGAIYILSPIDFLPEALLGPVGLIDDVIVGMIVFLVVMGGQDIDVGRMLGLRKAKRKLLKP